MKDTNPQAAKLEKEIVKSLLSDRKSERRWRNIRTFSWLFFLVMYAILIFGPAKTKITAKTVTKPYVSLVRLKGMIMPGQKFSAKKVIPLLNKAFADKKAKGVVLVINSPGGSPVQSSIIHDKIIQLKHKYKKRVIVLGEDTLASGAYLVAVAADKIFVNKDTLTGSIGVIMHGFGFTDAIQKLGITRRTFASGNNKDRLDPFLPLKSEDKTKIQGLLTEVHQNFIDVVVKGRHGKLRGATAELFSGDFWTGQQAVKLGLADGTGNLWEIMKSEFGVTHYKNYSAKPSLIQMIFKDMNVQLNLPILNERGAALKAVIH